MDTSGKPQTDQSAGVRPISFALDGGSGIGDPLVLPIRPEDLTVSDPQRVAVHQTLGGDTQGWVDDFGRGLPSITIAGHTGWNYKPALGVDGFQAFEKLHKMVVEDYPALRQQSAASGRDPDTVKLIFVDLLDDFAYPVVVPNFVLRRSRSRPLLYQYNIQMQATALSVDGGLSQFLPNLGSVGLGLGALDGVMKTLDGFLGHIDGWVAGAMGFVNKSLAGVGALAKQFLTLTTGICNRILSTVRGVNGLITGTTNQLLGIGQSVAAAGVAVFRTISAIAGIPLVLKASLKRVGAAFTELECIFKNSLRPRQAYQQYDGLYGAGNCSSTTGGRGASPFLGQNVFQAIQPGNNGVGVTQSAGAALTTLGRTDTVLSPLPLPALGTNLQAVVSGVNL